MVCRYIHIVLLAAFLTAGGCDTAKEQLGLEKKPPDEFAVVKRAPLAMPPDYALRPPRPGAPRPQEQETSKQARETVFGGQPQTQTETATSGEAALLQKAGTEQADPKIRQKVDAETAEMHDRNKPVAEKLLGIGGDAEEPSASVVDASKEAERIKKNIEEGKPVTEGETPYIEE